MQKRIKLFITLTLFLTFITGCNSKQSESSKDGSDISKTTSFIYKENFDGQEREMKITKAPERAVSMSQFTTEILLTLGLETRMAGTAFLEEDIYPKLSEKYNKVPIISKKWPSYEDFMATKPDFVTGWAVAFSKRGIESSKIIQDDIPIYIPNSTKSIDANLETLFKDILDLGKIFNVSKQAETYVNNQRTLLKNVQKKVKDLPEKTAFIFDSEDGEPFTVYEGFTTNLLSMIHVKNILSGKGIKRTWGKASWEDIINEDPQYIIIVDYGTSIRNTNDFDQKVASLKSNTLLSSMRAIKNNNFIRVKLSEIVPGVRNVRALESLAETIHGVTLD